MNNDNKIVVSFEDHTDKIPFVWLAYFDNDFLKGMSEIGHTKEEAFDELMISLKVKIAYDNNINL